MSFLPYGRDRELFEKLMRAPKVPLVIQAGKPVLLKKFAGLRRRGGLRHA